MNLRLHNKYGVNPTVFSCFVCGKDVGVALLGAGYHGEAPRHIGALDDKPCDECKKFMSQGVILISVKDGEEEKNMRSPYRTGAWCVIRDEAIRRMFTGAAVEDVLKKRICFVPDSVWDTVGLPRENSEATPRTAHDALPGEGEGGTK